MQDEGGRRYPPLHCTPQVTLWVGALKPVQVQVIFWLEKQTKQRQQDRNQPTSHTQRRKAIVGDPRDQCMATHSPKLGIEPKVHCGERVGMGHTHCRPTDLSTEVMPAVSTGGLSSSPGPFLSAAVLPQLLWLYIMASWPHSEIRETKPGLLEEI